MRYEDVADLIPGLVDGTVEVDERTQAFIESDLRCQAELARVPAAAPWARGVAHGLPRAGARCNPSSMRPGARWAPASRSTPARSRRPTVTGRRATTPRPRSSTARGGVPVIVQHRAMHGLGARREGGALCAHRRRRRPAPSPSSSGRSSRRTARSGTTRLSRAYSICRARRRQALVARPRHRAAPPRGPRPTAAASSASIPATTWRSTWCLRQRLPARPLHLRPRSLRGARPRPRRRRRRLPGAQRRPAAPRQRRLPRPGAGIQARCGDLPPPHRRLRVGRHSSARAAAAELRPRAAARLRACASAPSGTSTASTPNASRRFWPDGEPRRRGIRPAMPRDMKSDLAAEWDNARVVMPGSRRRAHAARGRVLGFVVATRRRRDADPDRHGHGDGRFHANPHGRRPSATVHRPDRDPPPARPPSPDAEPHRHRDARRLRAARRLPRAPARLPALRHHPVRPRATSPTSSPTCSAAASTRPITVTPGAVPADAWDAHLRQAGGARGHARLRRALAGQRAARLPRRSAARAGSDRQGRGGAARLQVLVHRADAGGADRRLVLLDREPRGPLPRDRVPGRPALPGPRHVDRRAQRRTSTCSTRATCCCAGSTCAPASASASGTRTSTTRRTSTPLLTLAELADDPRSARAPRWCSISCSSTWPCTRTAAPSAPRTAAPTRRTR